MARCSEAMIALIAGKLEDAGYGIYEIASLSAMIGVILLICWSIFHIFGKGAANNKLIPMKRKEVSILV